MYPLPYVYVTYPLKCMYPTVQTRQGSVIRKLSVAFLRNTVLILWWKCTLQPAEFVNVMQLAEIPDIFTGPWTMDITECTIDVMTMKGKMLRFSYNVHALFSKNGYKQSTDMHKTLINFVDILVTL